MKRILPITSAVALAAAASSPALSASPSDTVLEYDGHAYACTGIGDAAQEAPLWNAFPLKMVFTNVDGDYLGDVAITLKGEGGRTVVQAHCLAPWLMADVAPGNYTAEIVAQGQHAKTVRFEVDNDRQTKVVIPFPEITNT